jgi:hypothetical protein
MSTQFVFYGTNLGNGGKVNIEFYANYEVIPQVKSQQFRFATCRMSPDDPITSKMILLTNNKNLARPVVSQYCADEMEGHKRGFTEVKPSNSIVKRVGNEKRYNPEELFGDEFKEYMS